MYAIIESGSKQYRVTKGDVLKIEKIKAGVKGEVKLDKVLFVSNGRDVKVGSPYIKGASVICDIAGETKGKKTTSLKYRRRRASSKTKKGHRQRFTLLRVKEIAA